jgi:hypothetical protein
LAAFSVAEAEGSESVHVHILYKDEDDVVQHVWTTDSGEWQSQTAFRDIDVDSDIACITMSNGRDGDEVWTQPIIMRAGTHLSRCYYQAGGVLVEVQLQGDSEWVDMGTVTD